MKLLASTAFASKARSYMARKLASKNMNGRQNLAHGNNPFTLIGSASFCAAPFGLPAMAMPATR